MNGRPTAAEAKGLRERGTARAQASVEKRRRNKKLNSQRSCNAETASASGLRARQEMRASAVCGVLGDALSSVAGRSPAAIWQRFAMTWENRLSSPNEAALN